MSETRVCRTCGIEQDLVGSFPLAQKSYRIDCKICINQKAAERRKFRNKRKAIIRASIAEKTCTGCLETHTDVSKWFSPNDDSRDGFAPRCKLCYRKKVNQRRKAIVKNKSYTFAFNKTCYICKTTYGNAYANFIRDASCIDGLLNHCNTCKNAKNAKHRAYKLQATAPWADNQAIAAMYTKAAELTKSTGKSHHVDHIDPLKSKLVCGLHVAENLQVIPADINMSKSNKFRPYRYCFLTNATYYFDLEG